MGKIVLDLQTEALGKENNILTLLRKAYLVARKLKLEEFEEWTHNELNGYKDIDKLPDYRKIRGELKGWNPYRGWCPVVVENVKLSEAVTEHLVSDAISNLKNVYDKSNQDSALIKFGAEMNNYLSDLCHVGTTKYALILGANQIYNIIEQVRNIVLTWSLTLEENGILGEGLEFTSEEKEIAASTPIINNYTNNFYRDVQNTQIQQDTKNSKQQQTKI